MSNVCDWNDCKLSMPSRSEQQESGPQIAKSGNTYRRTIGPSENLQCSKFGIQILFQHVLRNK